VKFRRWGLIFGGALVLGIVFCSRHSTSAREPAAPELVIPFEDKLMVPLTAQVTVRRDRARKFSRLR
jgi:hypothetical protein